MGSWVHRLTNINGDHRLAECAACGPTKITMKSGRWKCATARQEQKGRRLTKKGPPRYVSTHYRKHKGTVCARCGFIPEDLCQLDVDHIDGNHNNNDPANLQTLCANCHRLKTKRNGDHLS